MTLDKDLYNEINEYCKVNSLKTRDFIHKLLREAFLVEKYGDSPFNNKKNHVIETVGSISDKLLPNGNIFPKEVVENAIKEFVEENKNENLSLDSNNIKTPVDPEICKIVDKRFYEMFNDYISKSDEVTKNSYPEQINKENIISGLTNEEEDNNLMIDVCQTIKEEEKLKVRKKRKLS